VLNIFFLFLNIIYSSKEIEIKNKINSLEFRQALEDTIYYDTLFTKVPIYKSEYIKNKKDKYINARNFITGYLYYLNNEWFLAEPFLLKALTDNLNIDDYIYAILSLNCAKKNDINCRTKFNTKLINIYETNKNGVVNINLVAQAYYDNSQLFVQEKKYNKAIESIDKYLNIEKGKEYILTLLKAKCLENLKRTKEALEIYKRLWQEYHNKELAIITEAKILEYDINISWNDKLQHINSIAEYDGYDQGLKAFSSLDKKTMDDYLNNLIDKEEYQNKRNIIKYNQAYMKFMLKEFDVSLHLLKELIAENYVNENVYYYLLLSYRRIGDYSSSYNELKKIIKRYPDSSRIAYYYYLAGLSLKRLNKNREAINYFDHIIKNIKRTRYRNEAYWELGFSYYIEKDYNTAINYLSKFNENINENYTNFGKALYWIARSYLELDEYEKGLKMFKNIISNYPFSYYSFLSLSFAHTYENKSLLKELEEVFVKKQHLYFTGNLDYSFENYLNGKEYYYRLNLFLELGFKDFAKYEISRFFNINQNNRKYINQLAKLFYVVSEYNRANYIMQVYHNANKFYGDFKKYEDELIMLYPQAFADLVYKYSNLYSVSPYLVFSIMKAESMFREKVKSPVGAVGLMQLMIYTAKAVANKIKYGNIDEKTLENIDANVRFGSFYLKKLNDEFKGYLPLLIASYNAGPHRITSWYDELKTNDIDVFIEQIPFLETRNYVKKVLSYLFAYHFLYANDNNYFIIDLKIPDALMQGPFSIYETW